MTTPHPDPAITSILADLLGPLCEQATGFTCREAELLADLYRAVGADSDAESLLDAHAHGDDDPEDMHADRLDRTPTLAEALTDGG